MIYERLFPEKTSGEVISVFIPAGWHLHWFNSGTISHVKKFPRGNFRAWTISPRHDIHIRYVSKCLDVLLRHFLKFQLNLMEGSHIETNAWPDGMGTSSLGISRVLIKARGPGLQKHTLASGLYANSKALNPSCESRRTRRIPLPSLVALDHTSPHPHCGNTFIRSNFSSANLKAAITTRTCWPTIKYYETGPSTPIKSCLYLCLQLTAAIKREHVRVYYVKWDERLKKRVLHSLQDLWFTKH